MKSNLVKIIATFGLIVVIALVLKEMFGIGEIGVNKITRLFKNPPDLPILRCTIKVGEESTSLTYNLQSIINMRPKDLPKDNMNFRNYFEKDGNWMLFSMSENKYYLSHINNKDGLKHGHQIVINKSSGDLELIYPPKLPYNLTLAQTAKKMKDAQTFYGTCYKITPSESLLEKKIK